AAAADLAAAVPAAAGDRARRPLPPDDGIGGYGQPAARSADGPARGGGGTGNAGGLAARRRASRRGTDGERRLERGGAAPGLRALVGPLSRHPVFIHRA